MVLGGKFSINDLGLHAYADAAFADDLATRFSTAGHIVYLAGAPVFWKSKRQTLVTLSSTKAEFINLTPTALSIIWIASMLGEAGYPQPYPSLMFTDSANARTVALNPRNPARTRHIDVKYKWVIQQVEQGKITVQHVPSEDMVADGLTKPLRKEKHLIFVRQLGLGPSPWS